MAKKMINYFILSSANFVSVNLIFLELFKSLENALRWGWVFLERTRILSGIQFTRHFIQFIVAGTKKFVGSNVNVILTRQNLEPALEHVCEKQRPSARKLFHEAICHMFLISRCRGDYN